MKNLLAAALCLFASTANLPAQADLDKLVPQLLKDGDVPGLSMALVRDGAVSWHHSWGVSDASTGKPIDDETIFEAASLSKPVFAYAVMKLVDAGGSTSTRRSRTTFRATTSGIRAGRRSRRATRSRTRRGSRTGATTTS